MAQDNALDVDLSKKLEIKINNKKPVGLADLTVSLLAFNHQFQRFVEQETTEEYTISSELFIKEVRSSSIIIELVSLSAPLVPLIWEGGPLSEWVNRVEGITNWLLGKINKPPKDMSKKDLEQWHSIVEPIAKDSASQMNVTMSDNNITIHQLTINSQEANALQNRVVREIENLEDPDDNAHRKKILHWYQTKFDSESHTGDKAIIEDISRNAIKVIFDNNAIKEEMLSGDTKFDKPWQKLAYIVDVEVQTINGRPKLYTILRYYPEHTFDPEE